VSIEPVSVGIVTTPYAEHSDDVVLFEDVGRLACDKIDLTVFVKIEERLRELPKVRKRLVAE